MNFSWRIIAIKPLTIVWDKLSKQQIVITQEEWKRNTVCIDFMWDNTKLLEWYNEWDYVSVDLSFAINPTITWWIFNRISWTSIKRIT